MGDRISTPSSQADSVRADSYGTLDLNAGLTIRDRWTVRAYVRNVTDTDGDISRSFSVNNSSLIGGPGFLAVTPVQPRTFGLGVELAF